jgi:tetratricopeptide (TPR) repeat protein
MQTIANAVVGNPNSPFVLMSAATVELHCGSLDDAIAHSRRAILLSPGDPSLHWPITVIAHAHMARGDYEEALSEAGRSLAVNSNYDPTYWMLIAANAKLGRMDEARDWLGRFQARSSGITIGKIRSWQPAKDPSRMAAIFEGLRLAGLDES